MSNEKGDVNPFQSAVVPASTEPPAPPEPQEPQSDADPFQSAQAAPQQASAEAPSDSGDAPVEAQDPFQAPS